MITEVKIETQVIWCHWPSITTYKLYKYNLIGKSRIISSFTYDDIAPKYYFGGIVCPLLWLLYGKMPGRFSLFLSVGLGQVLFFLYHPQMFRNIFSQMLQNVNLAISGCIWSKEMPLQYWHLAKVKQILPFGGREEKIVCWKLWWLPMYSWSAVGLTSVSLFYVGKSSCEQGVLFFTSRKPG